MSARGPADVPAEREATPRTRRETFPLVDLLAATWRYASERGRRTLIAFYVIQSAAQTVALLRPLALGAIFTTLEQGATSTSDGFVRALGMYLGLELVFMALHFPSRLVERRLAFRIRRAFYERTYATLTRRPLEWHRLHHSGDTINRMRKAGEALFAFAENQFRWLQTAFGLVGPVVMLLLISWPVAIVVVAINVAVLVGVSRYDRVIVGAMRDQNETEHRFASVLFDYVAHMTTILSLRLSTRTSQEVLGAYDAAARPFLRHVNTNEAKYASVSGALSVLEVVTLALFVGLEHALTGSVRIGMSVTVFRYLNIIGRTFYEAAYTYQDLLHRRTDLRAADPILEGASERPLVPRAPLGWHRARVEGLRYGHPGTARPCLDDITLELARGERVALLGASGAGKSTLLAALRGLLEPHAQRLVLDGRPVDDVDGFRAGVVLVPQQPELFESTLHFNATGGLPCSEASLRAALHDARFDDVLARLPKGLETDVRERGVNLSGGERQRLALARALLLAQDARLLLLDEATSSIDRDNERAIYERIFARFSDRTVVASIHGVHLLPMFDRVIVLDRGQVVEDAPAARFLGSHGLPGRLASGA